MPNSLIYARPRDFVEKEMSQSHIYQPVMLMALLSRDGTVSRREVATAILDRDPTQIEYYEQVVRDMVGRVLCNRKIVERRGNEYTIPEYAQLTVQERQSLISLCQSRLDEFEAKRGGAIREHRRRGVRFISGSIKYEVFKRAKSRC